MGTVDFTTERTFDRRIGRRLELDGIDVINVSWVVSQSGRFGRRKPPLELQGRFENVSVTGAAIVGPSELALKPGDEAVVRCGGRNNIVSIRHCEPTADEGTVRYGVEITSIQPNLKQRIRELLDPALARMPVESAPPGRLSLRSVARPTTPPPPAEVAASSEADDRTVLDLTDATMAAQEGAAVLDLTESAQPEVAAAPLIDTPAAEAETESVPAVEPIVESVPELVTEPEPQAAIEPAPRAQEPAATSGRDPHVPVAQPVHLPPLEMSEGRRVLDEVFGLMED